jgi:hypothetical protein
MYATYFVIVDPPLEADTFQVTVPTPATDPLKPTWRGAVGFVGPAEGAAWTESEVLAPLGKYAVTVAV